MKICILSATTVPKPYQLKFYRISFNAIKIGQLYLTGIDAILHLNRRYLSISETELGNNFTGLSNCTGNESMSVFSGICARKYQAVPQSIHILSWSYSLSTPKRQKEVSRERTLGSRFAFIWFERQNWRTELWTGLGLGNGDRKKFARPFALAAWHHYKAPHANCGN